MHKCMKYLQFEELPMFSQRVIDEWEVRVYGRNSSSPLWRIWKQEIESTNLKARIWKQETKSSRIVLSRATECIVPGSFGCGSTVFASTATLAPSRAARRAIARPMPRLAPVMSIVRPASVSRDIFALDWSVQWRHEYMGCEAEVHEVRASRFSDQRKLGWIWLGKIHVNMQS